MTARQYSLAVSVPIATFIVAAAALTQTARAQDNATAPAPPVAVTQPAKSLPTDPIATGLAAITLTDSQKTQIDAIVEKYRKEREALVPAPTGATTERPRLTPEQRTQIAASEAKEVAEIKAALPEDQQGKFQTAYDTARVTQASAPAIALLTEKLTLTDEEKTKITPIVLEYTGEVFKLREDTTLDRSARQQKQAALWDATKAKIRPLLPTEKQTTLDGITSLRGGRPGGNGGSAPAPGAPSAQ